MILPYFSLSNSFFLLFEALYVWEILCLLTKREKCLAFKENIKGSIQKFGKEWQVE